MPTDFHSTATEIISDSIKSAIFIDDKVLMPFEDNGAFENHDKLFFSFRERDSSLDFYRFEKEEWLSRSNYLFANRDLVILDWQLTSTAPTYFETLRVLEHIIIKNNIHFCCIFTETDKEGFAEKILFPILAYFSYFPSGEKLKREKQKYIYNICKDFIEKLGVDSKDFFNAISGVYKEIAFHENNPSKDEYIKQLTIDIFSKYFDEKGREFFKFLKENELTVSTALISIGYIQEIGFSSKFDFSVRISNIDLNKIYINDTIITIRNKEDIADNGLYEDFTNSLINEHNIFLTLLGMEMKNLVRKSSAFMGKDLSRINPLAFFYHQSTVDSKDDFLKFLNELWIDQASSFLNDQNPQILNYSDEFKKIFHLEDKLDEFKKNLGANPKYHFALGELNKFYNQLRENRENNSKIRFGDIFYFHTKEGQTQYLICLTPHCDCVDSMTKIGNKFYFILGGKMGNIVSGLRRAEKDYFSFVNGNDDELICIDWGECKPFTLFIPDNKLNALKEVYCSGELINIEYLCSIKENHAQRLANHSFAYPLRVGITMARIKE